MNRIFEIHYRENAAADTAGNIPPLPERPVGPIETARVTASFVEEARSLFANDFCVVRVKELGIELQPGQQWFRTEEAAEYLRIGVSTLYDLVAEGRLAKAKNGDPLYSRKDLDRVAAEGVGKSKKKNLKFPKAA